MKYLKYFQTETDYTSFKGSDDFKTPNVSYIVETDTVKYTGAIENE